MVHGNPNFSDDLKDGGGEAQVPKEGWRQPGVKTGSRRSRGRQDQCHRVSAIPDMMWDRDRGWVARDHMASGPSKLQEIEPLEADDNRQACETALTKVKCPHLDCGWELEVYPEVVPGVDKLQISAPRRRWKKMYLFPF